MATVGTGYWTLRDLHSGRLPNGNIDRDIVDMVGQENPALMDVPWKEAIRGREDITTIKTGMSAATLRAFYEGVKPSKTAKKQVTNAAATVSTALSFDWRLYEKSKDKVAFLSDEQRDHSDVLGQAAMRLLFYGDTKDDPRGINGFGKTYDEYAAAGDSDDRVAKFYCLNGGHSTVSVSGSALRSIYLAGWGKKSMHGFYPEGSSAGIEFGQLTKQYVKQDDGSELLMGIQEMNWDLGLNVRDYRYGGRICNIDLSRAFDTANVPDYTEILRRLLCRAKDEGVSRHLYMCRMLFEVLSVQFARKTQENAVKYADLQQGIGASLLGVPVSFNDALNIDEGAVPAAD